MSVKINRRIVRWWVSRCLNLAAVQRPPVDIRRVALRSFKQGLVEELEIRPAELESGYTGKLSAVRGKHGLRVTIYYEQLLEVPRARCVIAHEMWHLIRTFDYVRKRGMHKRHDHGREEAEADLFSRLLLMPERFMKKLPARFRKLAKKTKSMRSQGSDELRLRRLSLLHEIAARFVVPVSVADARMKEIIGRSWRSPLPMTSFQDERSLNGLLKASESYRIKVIDHRGRVTVLKGLSASDIRDKIEMTVTWSGAGPKKGRPPASALPAVVAISNEKKKRDCWYYEGVGLAGVLDIRGKWGAKIIR